jgi:2,3-bisphosphoglycerate-independent phosphoglycerate mutase
MKPVVLIILDGFGISPETSGNAIADAKKPNFDFIEKNFPFTLVQASGVLVGIPWGESGNSEVGHIAIGTGQIWHQPLTRITLAIQDGTFFQNSVLKKAAEHARENKSDWHLVGLLGSGSVHSYIDHLYALLEMGKNENIEKIWIHLFTDGRDSPPKESATFIQNLIEKLKWLGVGEIASVTGRSYGMDRNSNWERTKKAYDLIANGNGEPTTDFIKAIKKQYSAGITDEFLEPISLAPLKAHVSGTADDPSALPLTGLADETGKPKCSVKDNDVVIFFNFREDRARQISRAFAKQNFSDFKTKPLKNLFVASLVKYEEGTNANAVFPPPELKYYLSKILAENGKTQFKVAETEKYAHITYFFNGGREEVFEGEERKLIPSLPGATFAKNPQMKAPEISKEVIKAIKSGLYDFILANFANADMVGHTGDYEATVKAIEVVDGCIGEITKTVLENNYALIITADHGNAEQKINPLTGEAQTEHTTNPVPVYLIMKELKRENPPQKIAELKNPNNVKGILQDISATMLDLMGIPAPADLDGESLLPVLYKE